MQVPYEVQDTEWGKGLFAAADIPEGTLVWEYRLGVNIMEYDEQAALATLATKSFKECQRWLDLTYGQRGLLCEILDDGKYMNHSTTPNCKTRAGGNTYAIRNIAAGEQLFEDYALFDHPDFLYPLLEKYDCAPDYYDLVPQGMSIANISQLEQQESVKELPQQLPQHLQQLGEVNADTESL